MKYTAKTGWHVTNKYVSDIFILNIAIKNTEFDGYVLSRVSDSSYRLGSTREGFSSEMMNLCNEYELQTRTANAKDVLLVYIDDLKKIEAFFPEFITYSDTKRIQCGNIEFRSWKEFTRDDAENVMRDWGEKFVENKYPFLTPSQYPRRQIKQIAKGKAAPIFPADLLELETTYKAVHGGVLYNRPEDGIVENMFGFDICSAYIYSLLFKKLPMSGLERVAAGSWEDYLKKEDVGSIGVYQITYNSIFRGIHCFKDVKERPLQTGSHTVDIALSNVDLRTLIDCTTPGVSKIECKLLYVFKLDYLPQTFRLYCAREFLKKQTLPKDTAAYRNQKVILNGGFYGNLLYEANSVRQVEDRGERAFKLQQVRKEASTAPQWGVFTMSHAKAEVFAVGLQVSGWRYSDTDSIYCDADTYNLKLVDRFNRTVREENIELCRYLGYEEVFGEDVQYLYELGTFKLEAQIKRFRAWGCKVYAYETIEGEVIQKAAGCLKEKLPDSADTVFSPGYKPHGIADKVTAIPGHYIVIKRDIEDES